MNLQSDDFELFGVPRRFAQDRAQLDARWKELQREAHPDRFAAQGPAAQRAAMQWSVRINEAYQRLKDPLRRAAYLCELHGVPLRAEDNTAMPAQFLLQQMQWREALEEARSAAEVEALERSVQQAWQDTLARCAELLDQQQDWAAAAQEVRALMFLGRFAEDVERRREALGE
ncbi:Fe-S protein assembly co-chaperone HscB [Extensimonas vulgaris]|uniref:Co-chaperone protein HscB homolog n=1 Tax=Extensimonas vulgaris TaxID=1031594 RepID=A0A369ANJ5_9BURK|nr:Fe-S protein assembly co-chaperone HscB [Extensimonas vulgaris]RCX09846.1 molecular chaperone HscB [Extensimonas vulgaris]TWI39476.1 molecular chaperone HscB [Extensimonas vulgaris]TXD13036.1 Fe-S protein assembly co-chaperone HscB [Extensimonas vulgaris]